MALDRGRPRARGRRDDQPDAWTPGAIVYVGDEARIVLDPRAMWLADVQRSVRDECDARGAVDGLDGAFATLTELLGASGPKPGVEELFDTGSVLRDRRRRRGRAPACATSGARSSSSSRAACSVSRSRCKETASAACCSARGASSARAATSGAPGTCSAYRSGEGLLGRVVDALGRPIDGRGPIVPAAWMPAERPAPGRRRPAARRHAAAHRDEGHRRARAHRPRAARAHHRRPQDRQDHAGRRHDPRAEGTRTWRACTARSGRRPRRVRQVVDDARASTVRSSTRRSWWRCPAITPAFRYLAPYTACAIGEYFMDRGRRRARRLRRPDQARGDVPRDVGAARPPGRARGVPGRHLLRALAAARARGPALAEERGGGSLTALPIVETLAGDISAFIPTNVISICDGQIVLDAVAFNEGRRPAMDAGTVGVASGRLGPDRDHEAGRRAAAHRPRAVRGDGAVREVRRRGRRDDAQQLARGERARALLQPGPARRRCPRRAGARPATRR